jgi:hypothetical protein
MTTAADVFERILQSVRDDFVHSHVFEMRGSIESLDDALSFSMDSVNNGDWHALAARLFQISLCSFRIDGSTST